MVTFLFTDIEGSTSLWDRNPEAMKIALERHNQILYTRAEKFGGRVYKVVGDSFRIAFAEPQNAVFAALAAQRDFLEEDWGQLRPIRVRMGIHTGPAEVQGDDYVLGLTLFRVSHIMSAGHGGQTLLSAASEELVREQMTADASFKDLGEHRFKGLSQPEHVFQLAAPQLHQDFPPLRSESGVHHNLPVEVTSFVGRETEVAAVAGLLENPECRLVTILGPGGIGKTRLSLQVARRMLTSFRDGIWFVPLASLSSPDFLISAIGSALKLSFSSQGEQGKQLIKHLGQKETLLLLDNFDPLLPEGASIPLEILRQTAKVKLLVTSRERLELSGEWVYEVHGLQFPTGADLKRGDGATSVETYEAVKLFVQRARQTKADYRLSEQDIPHVIGICQLVEGMPLGLELAAPWIRYMPPEEIVQEIHRNLDFLATSMRNVPERHRSLTAIFDQTWERLTKSEQETLRKLSVFKGGCTQEAAEQVAGTSLAVLASLANKALLSHNQHGRYEMHAIVRLFALRKLQFTAREYEAVQNRHEEYYTTYVQQHLADLKGIRQKEALAEITAEIDNVRAAWQWAAARRDIAGLDRAAECLWLYYEYRGALQEGETAFRLAAQAFRKGEANLEGRSSALTGYLLAGEGWLRARRGNVDKGRARMEEGIGVIRKSAQDVQEKEASAVAWLGYVIVLQGRFTEAQQVTRKSLDLYTEIGDPWGIAGSLRLLGTAAQFGGRFKEAQEHLQRSLEVSRQNGQKRIEAYAIASLGMIDIWLGEYARAKSRLESAIQISRELDYLVSAADDLRELGRLYIATGEYQHAVETIEEALSIYEEIGRRDQGAALGYLGTALKQLGDDRGAERAYRASLAASRKTRHQAEIAAGLEGLGLLALAHGDHFQAEAQLKEALELWTQIGHEPQTALVLRDLGHLAAAQGGSHLEEARNYYSQALVLARKHELAPIALDVFVGFAGIMRREDNQAQQAIELLSIAVEHAASTHATRLAAQKQLAKLASAANAEPLRRSSAPGQRLDWQIAASQLTS
jgi:predicted ATPase/class 3 adenylate cyclase/Flp pilus assembly protein TadD